MKTLRLLIIIPLSLFAGLLLHIAEWLSDEPLYWYSKAGKHTLIEFLSTEAECTECGHKGFLHNNH